MTTTTTPETIAVASSVVRAEVGLRAADRASRSATTDLIGVEPDVADRVLTRMRRAAARARADRDAAEAAALAYFDAVEKEKQRHARALARIAKRHGKAVAK